MPSHLRSVETMSPRQKRALVRAASKRRVRGRTDVAPMPVQHAARTIDDAAHVGVERVRRVLAGDRALVVGLAVILAMALVVIAAPVNSFLDQRARVELAEQQLAALDEANGALEQRATDLTDNDHIEVLAREQLGYARPGEIAYSLVPPAGDDEPVVAQVEPGTAASSWWERLRSAFGR